VWDIHGTQSLIRLRRTDHKSITFITPCFSNGRYFSVILMYTSRLWNEIPYLLCNTAKISNRREYEIPSTIRCSAPRSELHGTSAWTSTVILRIPSNAIDIAHPSASTLSWCSQVVHYLMTFHTRPLVRVGHPASSDWTNTARRLFVVTRLPVIEIDQCSALRCYSAVCPCLSLIFLGYCGVS
jgi:hypothetical protein